MKWVIGKTKFFQNTMYMLRSILYHMIVPNQIIVNLVMVHLEQRISCVKEGKSNYQKLKFSGNKSFIQKCVFKSLNLTFISIY